MAANTVPIFTGTSKLGVARIATADTSRTAPASTGIVATAGTNGSLVSLVHIQADGTTTVGVIRVFVKRGGNFRLVAEILVDAVTPSTSLVAWSADWVPPGGYWPLESGDTLEVTTHNAEGFCAFGHQGDF